MDLEVPYSDELLPFFLAVAGQGLYYSYEYTRSHVGDEIASGTVTTLPFSAKISRSETNGLRLYLDYDVILDQSVTSTHSILIPYDALSSPFVQGLWKFPSWRFILITNGQTTPSI